MTVSTQTSRADYTGNGATTAFTVPFYFLDNSHVQIIRTQISTGVATTLALTTDYTLSGAGVNAGGTATMVTAPTADQRLTILRSVPFTQLTQYVPNDPFPAASHERALDLLTMEVQQLYENISRSLTLSANSSGVSAALPSAQATTLIGWNGTGTALQNYNAGSLGVAISYAAWQAANFSGDGVTTSFVIPTDAGVAANCSVSVGGVVQAAGINYTYTASTRTVTFLTGAPPVGVNNVNIRYGQALAQGTVASASITDATATGLSVLTAANQAAARTAIGAAASGANSDITSLTGLTSPISLIALRSYLTGCTLSTAGSSATMSIAAGAAMDSTNTFLMQLAATSKTTSVWAVGSAVGGLDTGTIANSTWYYFYAIRRPDTGVVDVVFSLSSSTPTLPSNYTQFRYIGAGLTNGSGQWTKFTQFGDEFTWDTPAADFNGTGTTTASLLALSVPRGRKVKALLNVSVDAGAGTGAGVYISDPSNADLAPAYGSNPLVSAGSVNNTAVTIGTVSQVQCWTNTSAQIRHRAISTSGLRMSTLGWTDLRGKDL